MFTLSDLRKHYQSGSLNQAKASQKILVARLVMEVFEEGFGLDIDDVEGARIPYGANVGLRTLAPGRYVLKVTVTDRNANASATNQVIFDVE